MKKVISIDGGSRGNPGPGALGVYFHDGHEYSKYLGDSITNNEAEYNALIFALKKIKAVYGKDKVKDIEIEIRSDSELVVKQMNGEYKINNPDIQKLFIEAWNLRIDFKKLKLISVRRELNKEADRLVNEALDAEKSKSTLF